ncbi:Hsp90 co-chaperone [Malassezia pachydermatis]|uniref:Sti1-hsp90 cochaperone n=1 Tax=Malassezia pachydermatis TaxID=77020 RepID=A0A0M9VNU2_9BASI|nr:sti1-hsp90 cochaperone [Malassezia pachydermatis]KOS13723.1 sti1-hsp90 cochaperone [Malassezia pachydermatis]
MSVSELKAQGNASFAAKDYESAIKHYTAAIEEAEKSGEKDGVHVLYSNRSASHAGMKNWDAALDDAEATIRANPSFAKGYGRKGSALHGAHRYEDAVAAYKAGLEACPDDAALKKGLADVERAMSAGAGSDPAASMANLFRDPQLFDKLSRNPMTEEMLHDAAFVQQLKDLQSGKANPMTALQDPRMIQVMGALIGVDMKAFDHNANKGTPMEEEPTPASAPKKEEPKKEEPKPAEEKPVDPKVAEAEAEKKKGNEHYLKRDFDVAAAHYQKAWELHQDITYLNNLGAVYFEKGDFDECIKTCEKAVEEGRSMMADYKLVAKAFGRIGSAYLKKNDLKQAITYFEKSLTEHRTPEILAKLRQAEKDVKEQERQAYIDPAKAEEERNRGNTLYKEGDFPGSVQAYTESIKRNPSDPRGYTNRASAYTKLAALPEALKDAEEAIKVDPKFVKAYIRKSNVLFSMKEYTKAMEAAQMATDVDEAAEGGAQHAREIQGLMNKCMQALYAQRSGESDEQTLERAMRDPEVAQIMQDPIMQSILQQAQSNPAALQDHMKNPGIRAKIQKLIAAGIIRTR